MDNKALNDLRKLLMEFATKYDARRVSIDLDMEINAVVLSVVFTDFYTLRRAYSFGEITYSNRDLMGDFEETIETHLEAIKNAELDSRPQNGEAGAEGRVSSEPRKGRFLRAEGI